ncbi:hypothetical protein ACRAWD_21850 [Caulobacter segnis]
MSCWRRRPPWPLRSLQGAAAQDRRQRGRCQGERRHGRDPADRGHRPHHLQAVEWPNGGRARPQG